MSKHTPGPWEVVVDIRHEDEEEEYVAGFDIIGPNGVSVVGCEGISGSSEVERENARLIASAPDLLKALEEMVDNEEQVEFESWLSDFSPSGDFDSVTAQWLASSRFDDFCAAVEPQIKAIAKAKGE